LDLEGVREVSYFLDCLHTRRRELKKAQDRTIPRGTYYYRLFFLLAKAPHF